MPLKKGKSKKVISENIRREVNSGNSRSTAEISKASKPRKPKKRTGY